MRVKYLGVSVYGFLGFRGFLVSSYVFFVVFLGVMGRYRECLEEREMM